MKRWDWVFLILILAGTTAIVFVGPTWGTIALIAAALVLGGIALFREQT